MEGEGDSLPTGVLSKRGCVEFCKLPCCEDFSKVHWKSQNQYGRVRLFSQQLPALQRQPMISLFLGALSKKDCR